METTKVINVNQNSLGFEIGEEQKWRGEFTLEQVAQFNIKEGKAITVNLLEMEETFASVEFGAGEKTTVPITKVSPDNDLFSPQPPDETDTPDFTETLRR
jgi:hypothetical protein